MTDTYAVVDKSKKTKFRNKTSTQLPLDPDPVADLNSVVDESNKSKPDSTTLTEDSYETVPTKNLYYSTVTATTDESAALHDCKNQVPVVSNAFSEKETLAPLSLEGIISKKENDQDKSKRTTRTCLSACFVVLIISVTAATIAVAMAFVLIAGLRSDLTAVMKNLSLRCGSSSDNERISMKSSECLIYQLNIDFDNFNAAVNNQVLYLNQNTSDEVEYLKKIFDSKLVLLRSWNGEIDLLTSRVNDLEKNFSEQHNEIMNETIIKAQTLYNKVVVKAMAASKTCLININTLTDKLTNGIQRLHSFDSCTAVSNFSIQLPSGKYKIWSGDSTTDQYCSTAIAFSCHGLPGRWRRIAYLSNNTSPVVCPMGFELITGSNVPALCKRNPTEAECSSITYSTNGISYSQVCGTIYGSYFGDPDGFGLHGLRSANTSLNGNYVDGISLTHGSMNEHHIWTLSAIVNFATNPTDICSVCANNKPSYVGMDYSCDVVEHCKGNCSPRQIWGNGQCIGNNTFYKNLMQPTSDDIEMRVCTDQNEGDEDIFLRFIEVYVM